MFVLEHRRQIERRKIDGVNEKRGATPEEITTGSDDGNGDLQCVCVVMRMVVQQCVCVSVSV